MKATILIAILLAGTGTSLVAEQALPGDMLYPVKVNVNEQVKSWFAIGAEAEAKLQADLLEERMTEIEALINEGKFAGDVATAATASFNAQLEKTIAASNEMQATADAETRANVRAALASALNDFSARLAGMKSSARSRTSGSGSANAEAEVDMMFDDIEASVDSALEVVTDMEMSSEEEMNEEESMDDGEMEDEEGMGEDGEMEDEDDTTASSSIEVDVDASLEAGTGTEAEASGESTTTTSY